MTEEEIHAIIARGDRAAQLLEDTTLVEALAALEHDAVTRWRATRAGDIDSREMHYHTLQGIEAFKAVLNAWVTGAKKAADDVAKQRRRDEARKAEAGKFRVVGGWRD